MPEHQFKKLFEGPISNGFVERMRANHSIGAYIIVAVWLAFLIAGLIYRDDFNSNGTISMDPPEGTESHDALEQYQQLFNPAGQNLVSLSCMMTSSDITNTPITGPAAQAQAGYFYTFAMDKRTSTNPTVDGYVGNIMTYWTLEAGVGPGAGSMVLNKGIPTVSNAQLFSAEFNRAADEIVSATDDLNAYFGKNLKATDLDIVCLSSSSILHDVTEDADKTLKLMDFTAIPIIIVLLFVLLKTIPMLMLPLIATGTALMASIFVCNTISVLGDVNYISISGSIMSVFTVALCVDFSLFILTRYTQGSRQLGLVESKELMKERGIRAVRYALATAGRNVAVSGTACLVCVMTMMIFPVSAMRTMGLFISITTLFTIATNLTLTPALLAAFPYFFQLGLNKSIRRQTKTVPQRVWGKISKLSIHRVWGPVSTAIVALIALLMIIPLSGIEISLSSGQAVPTNSKHLGYLGKIQQYFPGTSTEPIKVMVSTTQTSVFNEDTFNEVNKFIAELPTLEYNGYKPTVATATAISFVNGSPVPFAVANAFLNNIDIPDPAVQALKPSWLFLVNSSVSDDKKSLMIRFTPNINTYEEVEDFFVDLREIVDKYNDANPKGAENWTVTHSMFGQIDSVKRTYSVFGWILALIVVIVFAISFEAFRAIVAPVRTLVCVALTICFSMGAACLFREELFDIERFFYMSPILCMIIAIALSVDYDTFLSVSIQNELLTHPTMSSGEAVRRGVANSGATIVGAGLIMSSAFVVLLFSENSLMRQLGFMLTSTVLFDTILVCLVIQPFAMRKLGRYHWWPMGMRSIEKARANASPEAGLADVEVVEDEENESTDTIEESSDEFSDAHEASSDESDSISVSVDGKDASDSLDDKRK